MRLPPPRSVGLLWDIGRPLWMALAGGRWARFRLDHDRVTPRAETTSQARPPSSLAAASVRVSRLNRHAPVAPPLGHFDRHASRVKRSQAGNQIAGEQDPLTRHDAHDPHLGVGHRIGHG